ncbi:MAG: TPM domain-containing protein [Bacteroidales bacterium]|nr:TPM domain-containing protein [Bacteroidales bacterium]MCF8349534.1 TPM domain-containing protein [Bacteroidales bacterium]MCF8375093.1 TPM domain-containing protein [Bacteroidales bacterium]MCF8400000.1 TPM domain-containing protein [Bacteroidales bacterium]
MKHFIVLGVTLMALTITVRAQEDIPDQPKPPRMVVDFADILTDAEENVLERKLVAFNDTTSNQIAIVSVNSLGRYDITQYAYRLATKWGIGREKYNNGVLVLIKPKEGTGKGEANIEVGKGLEAAIPDITANRIIDFEMIPSFKEENYYEGINKAVNILMGLAAKEISSDEYLDKTGGRGGFPVGAIFPILFFIIIFVLFSRKRSKYYTEGGRRGDNSGLWTALFLGSMMGGGRSHGGWGNFSGGSGSFGGGGGGFGGFGGGGFGGGGASGSW